MNVMGCWEELLEDVAIVVIDWANVICLTIQVYTDLRNYPFLLSPERI